MSKNIQQVFIDNPIVTNQPTDLMYFGRSPYGAGDDTAMQFSSFSSQFGAPYTASALTKVDDTNVTLTLGGTPATSLLQATSITAGWTGQLSPDRGGTGVNNGTKTLTLGGNLTTSGAFNSTFTMTAGTAVTFPTSGTLATTSQIPTGAALTKIDDTNVTLTLGGSPTTALVNAASITAGWTGTLSGTRGGTGVNNGANTATYAGNLNFDSSFTTSGAFGVTQTYTGITNVTFPTSGTLATTSQLPTPSALTKVDDTNVTLTLGGTPATALLQATSITAGWTGQLALTRGGTNASLTASNGGIVWSNATQLQVLAGTATAGQILRSGSSATPSWSTTTYPSTNAINTLLYASAANVMSALATANNGILVTSNTGAPSIGNTVGAGLTMPSVTFNTTTGVVGTTTNNNAAAGSVGETISSSIASGSAVALTNGVTANITSISLTAGDWDVEGYVAVTGTANAIVTRIIGSISQTSATLGNETNSDSSYNISGTINIKIGTTSPPGINLRTCRMPLSGTTTVYLVTNCDFTVQPLSGYGIIIARRRR